MTSVNLSKLSSNPFSELEEEWIKVFYFHVGKPVKDFYFSENSLDIYTLYVDNYISLFKIDITNNFQINYTSIYSFNIYPGCNLNKFIFNRQEDMIFCFFDEFFRIFKKSEKPPFHQIYFFYYNDMEYIKTFKYNENFQNNIIKDYNNMQNKKKNKKIEKKNKKNKKIKKKNKKDKKNKIKIKNDKNELNGIETESIGYQKNSNSNEELFDYQDEEDIEIIEANDSSSLDESEENIEDSNEFDDFIDFNEKMDIQDTNFIFNEFQNGILSPNDENLVFSFFNFFTKKFYLIKFNFKSFFHYVTSDYEFFKNCYNGNNKHLCEIILSSNDRIVYSYPPSVYYKQNKENLFEKNTEEILNLSINLDDFENNNFTPLAVLIDERLLFMDLNIQDNKNKILFKYNFLDKEKISYEALNLKWLYNNTLLYTSEKELLKMIKFSGEFDLFGILIKKNFIIDSK